MTILWIKPWSTVGVNADNDINDNDVNKNNVNDVHDVNSVNNVNDNANDDTAMTQTAAAVAEF